MPNSYQYSISSGTKKGHFNVFQARDGSIHILMGRSSTELTKMQIDELSIDINSLIDFDQDNYSKYYNL